MHIAVITGATHGLGRLVALDLARRGLHLGVVARSAARADRLRSEVADAAPAATVDTFLADLSSLSDVRRIGEAIAAHYGHIDLLVNNAGLHAFSQRITVDGLAEMTAVNYLAPWVLTNTLRDRLVGPAPARVVTVASEAARHAGDLDPARDLTFTGDYGRRESAAHYGRTKLMSIMFSQELARRLRGTGVTANCCDPGFNTTGLGRELPGARILERTLRALRVGDPARGAGIIARLATDPAFATRTGGYFSVRDARPLQCPEPGRSEAVQRELWEATERLLDNRS
jgi:NAD(P)-dependent dehydrogenase (short-subunit alcohol dehydrogenase family)